MAASRTRSPSPRRKPAQAPRSAASVQPRRFLAQHEADVRVLAEIVDVYVRIAGKLLGAAVLAWAASCVIGGRAEQLDPWLVAGGGGAGALLLFSKLTGAAALTDLIRPRGRRPTRSSRS